MRNTVYVTVGCSSDFLSSYSPAAASCGGFAVEMPVGRRYRSIAAGAMQQTPALSSNGAQQQMRAAASWQPTGLTDGRTPDRYIDSAPLKAGTVSKPWLIGRVVAARGGAEGLARRAQSLMPRPAVTHRWRAVALWVATAVVHRQLSG